MAGRIRTIKPEWLEDEKMLLASNAARVLSIALILEADDHGRGRANEALIVSRIFPGVSPESRESYRESREAFRELVSMGYINAYSVRGQSYFEIANWTKHQKVDKPGKPRVPAPCESDSVPFENIPETLAKVPETLATDHDHDHIPTTTTFIAQATPERVKSEVSSADLESVYDLYPRKQGKAKGLDAAAKVIKTRHEFELYRDCVTFMARAFKSKDARQFCPHFSTFINGKLWRDEEWPGSDRVSAGSTQTLTPGQQLDLANEASYDL